MITDYANGFIRTFDNILTEEENAIIGNELSYLQFVFGETDESDTPPSGLVSELSNDHFTKNILLDYIYNNNLVPNTFCDRAYVNLYAPNERTFFHHDFTEYTALYYPGPSWNINAGGETKFFFTENKFDSIIQENSEKFPIMISIAPIPNRLVVFKGDILHSATSFIDVHRYSVAFKFLRNENEEKIL